MYDLSNEEFAIIKKYVFKQNLKNITGAFFFFLILLSFNFIIFGYLWLEHYPSVTLIIIFALIDIFSIGATIFLINTGNLKIKYLDNVIVENINGKFIHKSNWTGDFLDSEYFIDNLKVLVPRRLLRKKKHGDEIYARVAHISLKTNGDKTNKNVFPINDSLVIGLNE